MNKDVVIILTCEHASSYIPQEFKSLFPKNVLNTHRGIDIGAIEIANKIQKKLKCKLFQVNVSRLVIEVNRSPFHPKLFSEYMKDVPLKKKNKLFKTIYLRHRKAVENEILKEIKKGHQVIHLGIHSFTPVINGKKRIADIGLLFDPNKSEENAFCTKWNKILKKYGVNSRKNYPYWGKTDGFTTYLRGKTRSKGYIGVEVEISQNDIFKKAHVWSELLVQSLQTTLHTLQ
jgi:predicted N-formylglutamate amidohydrolase